MGGPDAGATGYAVGVERLLLAIDRKDIRKDPPGTLVIPVDDTSRSEAFRITSKLWREGIPCEMDHTGRSFKGRMRKADKDRRKFVIILGEEEIKSGKLLLKDMESGEQRALGFEEILKELRTIAGKKR